MDNEVLSLVSEKERLKNAQAELLSQASTKKGNAQLNKLKQKVSTAEAQLTSSKKELDLAKSAEAEFENK